MSGGQTLAALSNASRISHGNVANQAGSLGLNLWGVTMPPLNYLSSVEQYDPVAGTWMPATPLSTPGEWHTATCCRRQVLVSGGSMVTHLKSVEIYSIRQPEPGSPPNSPVHGPLGTRPLLPVAGSNNSTL